MKILIQRCDKLGDNVLILPLIAALRAQLPTAEIHILTSAVGATLMTLHPDIAQVYTFDHAGNFSALWEMATTLKQEKYDIYLSVWNHPKMAWLGFLARIPMRVGDASNPSLRWLYTHPVSQNWANMTLHWSLLNSSLLAPIFKTFDTDTSTVYQHKQLPPVWEQDAVPVGVPGNPEAEVNIAAIAATHTHKKRVLIFVGTGGTNFPIPENEVLRVTHLIGKTGLYHVFLCGQNAGKRLMALETPYSTNLIGKTSLPELIAWIRQCDIYIGPDTGPTQIASMMGKPIVFFSPVKPNPPSYWGPLSPAFRIIREEYRCPRFCAKDGCRASCFDFLTGDRLYTEFCDLVAQLQAGLEWTPAKRAKIRLQHTLRILVIGTSTPEWEAAKHAEITLANQGLMLWSLYLKSPRLRDAFRIVALIKERNINVIHAPFLPKSVMILVRLIMGIWYAYPSPLHVPAGISADTDASTLMELYKTLWKQA